MSLTLRTRLAGAAPLALVLPLLAPAALAQAPAPPPTARHERVLDTGLVHNEGREWAVIAGFDVVLPDADWIRLEFDEVLLAGDPFAGTGTEIRITGHADGALQVLNRVTAEQWRWTSAYFNGGGVTVELWAAPGTGASRVRLAAAEIGLATAHPVTQCGATDDRVLSSDPRACRIMPVGCTAWLIDDCAGCLLTAGHCMGNVQVAQFNVPLSSSGGGYQNPPPQDQYPIDSSTFQSVNGGIGNDWAYLGAFPNSNTGLTMAQAQGQTYVLAPPPPFDASDTIRITGYGTDNTPLTHNGVQQTSTGPWTVGGGSLGYRTDTEGGNSGSPILHEDTGHAIGIHCHGGCSTGGGTNWGSASTNAGLQAALANPLGVCRGGARLLSGLPSLLGTGQTAEFEVQIDGGVVGTPLLHVRYGGGPEVWVPLAAAAGNVWRATLPPPVCVGAGEYWISAQTSNCGAITLPEAGPQAPFSIAIGDVLPSVVDDMEADLGWNVSGNASTGHWVRVDPIGTVAQPEDDHSSAGTVCWVTGQGTPGGAASEADVDGGATLLVSPAYDVTGLADPLIGYWRWYSNDQGTSRGETLRVHVSADDGASWELVEIVDTASGQASGGWYQNLFRVADFVTPSAAVRVRFRASDTLIEGIVEAAIDDLAVGELGCASVWPDCNQNGIVDADDVASGRSLDLDQDGVPDECVSLGTVLCAGDGSGALCPCGNAGGPGEGCAHSGGHGMTLTASGSTSVAADDLVVTVTGAPLENSGIVYVGRTSLAPGVALFDGLQCAGGDVRRFGGLFNATGTASDGHFGAQAGAGYFLPALSYVFQYWTRDVATGASPCGSLANFSPGRMVTMTP